MGHDRLIEQLVVARHGRGHGVGCLLPPSGRSLDIAQQERDGAGWQRDRVRDRGVWSSCSVQIGILLEHTELEVLQLG